MSAHQTGRATQCRTRSSSAVSSTWHTRRCGCIQEQQMSNLLHQRDRLDTHMCTQRGGCRYTQVLPRKKKPSCMQTHASHISDITHDTRKCCGLRLGPYILPRVHNVAAAPTARLQPTNANSALQYLPAYACTAVHHACAPMTHDSLHMQQQTHVRGAL